MPHSRTPQDSVNRSPFVDRARTTFRGLVAPSVLLQSQVWEYYSIIEG
jgi:hypothetical protein